MKEAVTAKEIGEFALIERLVRGMKVPTGVLGAGDDCAVIPLSNEGPWCLLTTDSMVEGCHFRFDFSMPFDVGWKALASAASDIAAMGGSAIAALIALQMPGSTCLEILDGIYEGIGAAGEEFGIPILGGDTTESDVLSLCVSVSGIAEERPIYRSGAADGEDIWLSGSIGGAGAGLSLLEKKLGVESFLDGGEAVLESHRRPKARLALGEILLERRLATSMIDVSDGLLQDMGHLCEKSGVSCMIELDEIPLPESLRDERSFLVEALSSGDDYELLFTAKRENAYLLSELSGVSCGSVVLPTLKKIGAICETDVGRRVVLRLDDTREMSADVFVEEMGPGVAGYRHFGD